MSRWSGAGRACAGLALRRPRLLAGLGVALFLAAWWPASRVGFDASVERWFLPGDGTLARYQEFREEFGNDEFLLVVLAPGSGNVFRNDVLAAGRDLAAALAEEPLVFRVQGLHDFVLIEADADTLRIAPAVGDLPLSEGDLARVREAVLADPRAAGFVVDDRGALTSLVVELHGAGLDERLAFARRVADTAARFRTPALGVHVMGDVVLHRDLYDKVQRDLRRVLPLLVVMLAGVLWLAFRGVTAVLLCLGVVATAVVGARAAMGLAGWGDSPLLTLVPVVLVVTSVADAVHVLDRTFALRARGAGAGAAVGQALEELFRPCLVTSLTTAAGFLALTVSPLFPLRQLGILAATGVGVSFVYSVLVLPAALVALDVRGYAGGATAAGVLERVPRWIARRRRWVLAGAGALTVLGVAGALRLQAESRYLETFHAGDPMRVEAEWVERNVGGMASLEAVVAVEPGRSVLEPEVLGFLRAAEETLRATAAVTDTRSLADLLVLLNRAATGVAGVPGDAATASQMLLLYETLAGEDLSGFVDLDRSHARIWARSRFASASEVDAATDAFARVPVPAGVSAELTGALLLFRRMSGYIVGTQVRSFALALVAVTAFLVLALRSWRLGLLSLVPNLWPLVLTLGVMGLAGWWLQPSTAMVAAIALGIGVDDSVHFLDRYQAARREGRDPSGAVAAMFGRAGRAVTLTTVILVLGFAAALASSLRETALFAGLCLIALGLAWVGDVLLLPALLLTRVRGGRG